MANYRSNYTGDQIENVIAKVHAAVSENGITGIMAVSRNGSNVNIVQQTVDSVVTAGSDNPVTSGAVHDAMAGAQLTFADVDTDGNIVISR